MATGRETVIELTGSSDATDDGDYGAETSCPIVKICLSRLLHFKDEEDEREFCNAWISKQHYRAYILLVILAFSCGISAFVRSCNHTKLPGWDRGSEFFVEVVAVSWLVVLPVLLSLVSLSFLVRFLFPPIIGVALVNRFYRRVYNEHYCMFAYIIVIVMLISTILGQFIFEMNGSFLNVVVVVYTVGLSRLLMRQWLVLFLAEIVYCVVILALHPAEEWWMAVLAICAGLMLAGSHINLESKLRENVLYSRKLAEEREKYEVDCSRYRKLLASAVPFHILNRWLEGQFNYFVSGPVTVMAISLPPISSMMEEDVHVLSNLFNLFDMACIRNGLFRVSTLGETYVACSGLRQGSQGVLPERLAERAASAALEIMRALDEYWAKSRGAGAREDRPENHGREDDEGSAINGGGRGWAVRIGLASGVGVGGLLGAKKFGFDVWGSCVLTAESWAPAGCVGVHEQTQNLLQGRYLFEAGPLRGDSSQSPKFGRLVGVDPGVSSIGGNDINDPLTPSSTSMGVGTEYSIPDEILTRAPGLQAIKHHLETQKPMQLEERSVNPVTLAFYSGVMDYLYSQEATRSLKKGWTFRMIWMVYLASYFAIEVLAGENMGDYNHRYFYWMTSALVVLIINIFTLHESLAYYMEIPVLFGVIILTIFGPILPILVFQILPLISFVPPAFLAVTLPVGMVIAGLSFREFSASHLVYLAAFVMVDLLIFCISYLNKRHYRDSCMHIFIAQESLASARSCCAIYQQLLQTLFPSDVVEQLSSSVKTTAVSKTVARGMQTLSCYTLLAVNSLLGAAVGTPIFPGRSTSSSVSSFDSVTVLAVLVTQKPLSEEGEQSPNSQRKTEQKDVRSRLQVVEVLDTLAEEFGAERIRSSAGRHILALGVPDPIHQRDARAACLALTIVHGLQGLEIPGLVAGIGIARGPCLSGLVNYRTLLLYDIWGPVAATALRLSYMADPGQILLTGEVMAAMQSQERLVGISFGPVSLSQAGAACSLLNAKWLDYRPGES